VSVKFLVPAILSSLSPCLSLSHKNLIIFTIILLFLEKRWASGSPSSFCSSQQPFFSSREAAPPPGIVTQGPGTFFRRERFHFRGRGVPSRLRVGVRAAAGGGPLGPGLRRGPPRRAGPPRLHPSRPPYLRPGAPTGKKNPRGGGPKSGAPPTLMLLPSSYWPSPAAPALGVYLAHPFLILYTTCRGPSLPSTIDALTLSQTAIR